VVPFGTLDIGTDTYQSATYDFLLTFHVTMGLSRTVSEINVDFSKKKSPIFPPRVFNAPAEGSFVSAQGADKTRMKGLPDDRKSFKIG